MTNLVPIDFEYHSSEERQMHLVSCSLRYKDKLYEFWLNDKSDTDRLKRNLLRIREEGRVLVCFNAVAEGSAIYSLGINPIKFKWLDIQAEYKMLLNHNDKYRYGKQYLDGKYKVTTPPRGYKKSKTQEERDHISHSKPKSNLLACTYKMLDIPVDSEYKTKMRDIILTRDFDLIESHKKEIIEYCSSDVHELIQIWSKIKEAYKDYFQYPERMEGMPTGKEALYRGESVVRSAIMQRIGYPVNIKKLTNLAANTPVILRHLIEDINSQFDWDLFSPNKSNIGYKQNQKVWGEFIAGTKYGDNWTRTDTKAISLKLEAFTDTFSYRHDYPKGNFFAQAIRFLKTKQALNGLSPSVSSIKKKDTIFDNIGSDGRVRYYPNSYGTMTSRFAPPAKSFIFLKPSWMRGIVEPPKGRAICSIDYKSEEALIAGLESKDPAIIEAYASGDVYLDYAKRAGAVPQDATKSSHKKERDLFKATYLGISYQMGAKSLGRKLTNDTGIEYTEEDAKGLIRKFKVAYPVYNRFVENYIYTYSLYKYHKLRDGWTLFGGQINNRSVGNFPMQGSGGVILRKAIALTQDSGLTVLFGLHDALYIEYDLGDFKAIDTLATSMEKAFIETYPEDDNAKLIKLDIDTWSPEYKDHQAVTPSGREINVKSIYIDPRGEKEYHKFSKYMEERL